MTCQSHLSFTKKNNNYRWHFVPGLVLLIALFYMTSLNLVITTIQSYEVGFTIFIFRMRTLGLKELLKVA